MERFKWWGGKNKILRVVLNGEEWEIEELILIPNHKLDIFTDKNNF